ncbi:MAG: mechanosensitive ion channel family protein [Polyangiales bacterium]
MRPFAHCLVALVLLGPAAFAQPVARAAPGSPRESMARFRDLARAGRWAEAARYVELPPGLRGEGPRAAQELFEVVDHELGLDPASLSGEALGDPDDGLPPRTDALGEIDGGAGADVSVRIARRELPDGTRWVFTRATVQRADALYDRLGGSWARQRLPRALLARGPKGLLRWQWLGLPVLLALGLALGRVVAALSRRALVRVAGRHVLALDPRLPERITGPLSVLVAALALRVAPEALALSRDGERFVEGLSSALLLGAVFWAAWRGIEVAARAVAASSWAAEQTGSVTVLPLLAKAARVALSTLGVVAVLSALGYPVASLLAGLGIGGLALALAAQKTGEHLIGSVAIGFDQPFQVGDLVKVDDQTGRVEAVGLRSTRIRTFDRSVISFPNGKLADLRTENLSARDRFRVATTLGLAPSTDAATLRAVLAEVRALLEAHPKLADDAPWVSLLRVGALAIEVEVAAWFRTTDMEEFLAIRSEVLLGCLDVIERHRAQLAAPPPAPPPPAPPSA